MPSGQSPSSSSSTFFLHREEGFFMPKNEIGLSGPRAQNGQNGRNEPSVS